MTGVSKHERWGNPCHFCEEFGPCETVTLRAENARLREQADALATAHQRVRSIILSVENRCMAADGPVSRTLEEMTEDELRAIWQASDAALRAYQEATP